jgi:cytoplasmic iron level regulating protein YaaA (DUF328/UPF0246 family)
VLILLPPSEGKTAPRRGGKLNLSSLAFGDELLPARQAVLNALIALCHGPAETAMHVLELPPGLAGELETNRRLLSAPTTAAAKLYTGVLFEHLGLETLDPAAKRRANRSVLIAGGLWGVVAPGDRVPAYRLSGSVTLPPLGTLAGHWRGPLSTVLPERAGRGLILDLRSGTYANAWRPTGALAERTVTVRVTHHGKVVSHHNKATKGLLARAVLAAGVDPKRPDALAQLCKELGFDAVLSPLAPGRSRELSVDDVR